MHSRRLRMQIKTGGNSKPEEEEEAATMRRRHHRLPAGRRQGLAARAGTNRALARRGAGAGGAPEI